MQIRRGNSTCKGSEKDRKLCSHIREVSLSKVGSREGESGERSKGSIRKSSPLYTKGYGLEPERRGYH